MEQIVRRYQRPIIRLIFRITGDSALSEDLAQDTFVKAFRNLAAFDTKRRLSAWLFRIAHNTALDSLRRARIPTVPLDPATGADLNAAAPADPDPLEQETLRKALDGAMAGIRPDQRAALTLRYEEGLSFAEIGQILGIPEATARSHVHRARRDLSACLSEAGWGPSERLQRHDAAVRKP